MIRFLASWILGLLMLMICRHLDLHQGYCYLVGFATGQVCYALAYWELYRKDRSVAVALLYQSIDERITLNSAMYLEQALELHDIVGKTALITNLNIIKDGETNAFVDITLSPRPGGQI